MKLGIFGGTFNPVHYGHLRAAEEVRQRLGLMKVIFMPAGNPPLKSADLQPGAHRLEMTKRAVSSNPRFEVSDIECRGKGKSYSVDTMKSLRSLYPGDRLFFILGADAFLDLPHWKSPMEVVGLSDFAVIPRHPYGIEDTLSSPYLKDGGACAGDTKAGLFKSTLLGGRSVFFLTVTNIDISSTMIRKLISAGRSVKYLLPEEVESYIISNRLYRRRRG
ncbi:MAG: nicotinate-nucleotide adenylyltransferase [Thermodesulfovibrionales bacterium]|nr:nicotinate-nucleotide adenylyltransferase [Thermodesulfovibrionales bacterium]